MNIAEGHEIVHNRVHGKRTIAEHFRWGGGKWYKNKEGKWKQATSLEEKRAHRAFMESLQVTLFSPAPTEIQELREKIDALESRIAPPTHHEPHEDDITDDTIVRPELYDEDFLGPRREDVLVMHRVKVNGHGRLYAVKRRDPGGDWGRTEFYTGVTSVCDAVLGYDDGLVEWYCGFPSYEAACKEVAELADFGTFAHGLLAKCAKKELPDFDSEEWGRMVRKEIARHGHNPDEKFHQWNSRGRKTILSFKQWVHDRRVTFHAIEIPLGIPHTRDANGEKVFGYFAQLDFIVTMDREDYPDDPKPKRAKLPDSPKNGRKPKQSVISSGVPYVSLIPATREQGDSWGAGTDDWNHARTRAIEIPAPSKLGASVNDWTCTTVKCLDIPQLYIPYPDAAKPVERERVTAIVDFKSGKYSYPSHDLQLQLQVPLLKHNFPHLDLRGIRLYNLHVTDWQESRDKPTFGYSCKDKTNEMARVAELYLEIWRRDHAREVPRKVVYQGSPNLGTPPSENTYLMDFADYFDDRFHQAITNKRIFLTYE